MYKVNLVMFIHKWLLFPARDKVYKSSWFAYESLKFVTHTTKPRGNKSHVGVCDNVYFTETKFLIGATFKRRHSATILFLNSEIMLIPPYFTCNLSLRKRSHIIITHDTSSVFTHFLSYRNVRGGINSC